ncbi:MAG: type II toxin-antitoxin system HicB family antitoxin [Candidatus Diapherotrites archaeon]|nr:type II toxin-antitoxin system HicB family antitoxin [Candidatus Diapherotrites archaeon]
MLSLTAIISKDEDMFVAKCPEIGTVSQGKTIDEALKNLKEATELYLEEFPIKKISKPFLTTFEVANLVKA